MRVPMSVGVDMTWWFGLHLKPYYLEKIDERDMKL